MVVILAIRGSFCWFDVYFSGALGGLHTALAFRMCVSIVCVCEGGGGGGVVAGWLVC